MIVVGAILTVLIVAAAGTTAAAADLCDALFVPEPYDLVCTPAPGTPGEPERVIVRSTTSRYGPLNELALREVAETVDDPGEWLRRQLILDLSDAETALRDHVDDPDSPFADTGLDDFIESILATARQVAQLPLEGCDEPAEIRDGVWEMRCLWDAGLFRQHLAMRLVDRRGEKYAITMRSVNERRLRHFLAIANSFE